MPANKRKQERPGLLSLSRVQSRWAGVLLPLQLQDAEQLVMADGTQRRTRGKCTPSQPEQGRNSAASRSMLCGFCKASSDDFWLQLASAFLCLGPRIYSCVAAQVKCTSQACCCSACGMLHAPYKLGVEEL